MSYMLSAMVALCLGDMALLITYKPDQAILFARIFAATCIGIARLVGIA